MDQTPGLFVSTNSQTAHRWPRSMVRPRHLGWKPFETCKRISSGNISPKTTTACAPAKQLCKTEPRPRKSAACKYRARIRRRGLTEAAHYLQSGCQLTSLYSPMHSRCRTDFACHISFLWTKCSLRVVIWRFDPYASTTQSTNFASHRNGDKSRSTRQKTTRSN